MVNNEQSKGDEQVKHHTPEERKALERVAEEQCSKCKQNCKNIEG